MLLTMLSVRPPSTTEPARKSPEPDAPPPFPLLEPGNTMIGLWMFAWNSEHLKLAQLFVTINSLSQLFYVYALLPPSTRENRSTRLVAQTFAGIGLLDLIHNGSVAFYEGVAPK